MSDENITETDSDDQLTPPEIAQTAKNMIENHLPAKSKEKYTNTYNKFIQWTTTKETKPFSESTILTYLTELSKTHKPSTLWATYSMLKTTLNINNNINIEQYDTLTSFLKRQSQGYTPKKSKVLTAEQIKKFLNEADDEKYLLIKVAMIFGICGACRREELTNIKVNDIEDKETVLLVKIPTRKTYKSRSFIIADEFYTISKKYINLRPKNVEISRFFLNYQNGQCTRQPVGINKFGKIPTIIASYLQLANPHSYTGHTFRRTSATLLADSGAHITTLKRHGGWKSNTGAPNDSHSQLNLKEITTAEMRTTEEGRKQVVADWKCQVKKQYAELKKNFTATGGGAPVMENLTDQEILNIIGMTAADGDEGLQEYGLEFDEPDEVIKVLSVEDMENPSTSRNKRPRPASLPNHSEPSSQRARSSSESVDSFSVMNNTSLSVLNDINGNLMRIADCLEIIVKRAFPE